MQITPFPYQKNSAALFECIAKRPYAIFLDSHYPHYANARFDILSAEPHTLLQGNASSTQNPFQLSQALLLDHSSLASKDIPSELPFTIGILGYFAYDVGRQLETIPSIACNDISLPDFCLGFYHWSIIVDHKKQKSWLITTSFGQARKVMTWFQATTNKSHFYITTPFHTNLPMSLYKQAFNQLKQYIRNGDCYEANLCQRLTSHYRGDPWQAYKMLRQYNPAPHAAYFNLDNGAILSFSPERFLSVHKRKVQTQPIKGTAPRSKDKIQDQYNAEQLKHSTKDQAENLMIVDLLRNDLGKCCIPGSIQVPQLFKIKSFPNVHHLVSTVIGTLENDQQVFDLLEHCFPGGSITGAPKISAMKIIETLEPHRRSVYCGSLGYADIRGHMDFNIVIRTLICTQKKIHGYAGGAIVNDSLCEQEYQETHNKIDRLLKPLERQIKHKSV